MPDEAVIEPPQAASAVVETPTAPPETIEQPTETPEAKPAPGRSFSDLIRAKVKATEPVAPDPDPDKEKPTKPVKAKAPKKEPEPKKTPVDPIKLAEAQGREIGNTIAKSLRRQEEPAKQPVATGPSDDEIIAKLPEEYREDSAVYQKMKQLWPDKYGKLLQNLSATAEKETAYIEKWQEENPGSTYDPDAEEHQQFYKSAMPAIQEKDFSAAKDRLMRDQIKDEVRSELSPEIESIKRANQMKELAPTIAQKIGDVLESALDAINPELAGIARDPEKLKGLSESDPVVSKTLQVVHQEFSPLMVANTIINRRPEDFDSNNPAHVEVYRLAVDAEKRIAAASEEQQLDSEGRTFATRRQYSAMDTDERAKHWTLDEEKLAYLISQKAAQKAKAMHSEITSQFESWAKQKGIKLPSASDPAPKPNGSEPTPKPATTPKPASPPVPGRGQLSTPWSQPTEGRKSGGEMFLKFLRGG